MEGAVHSDLTGIAIVAVAAMLCGLGLERLRQPAVVGYIVAGTLLGPSAFAVVDVVDEARGRSLIWARRVAAAWRAWRARRRLPDIAAKAAGGNGAQGRRRPGDAQGRRRRRRRGKTGDA
jgi:hypothetical protein